jgi:hypothetical protein
MRFPYTLYLLPSTGIQLPASTILLRPCIAPQRRCWNINQLAIDYAFRPRLRFRLTLRGLTSPRNPWAYGGGGSHTSFATHVRIRTRLSSKMPHDTPSTVETTLPYHALSNIRCFGDVLEPRYIFGADPLD